MAVAAHQLLLYSQLAPWWSVLSPLSDYAEEAEMYAKLLSEAVSPAPRTLLELGAGGGNNASYMKRHFQMTLVDLSPQMLQESRKVNPELEHVMGDMRTLRLGRLFDAVFIHDAIVYAGTEEELRQTLRTAAAHCRPGGAALFAPDHTRETFVPNTEHDGHDSPERSIRYLSWEYDPDPGDTSYDVAFAFLCRQGDAPPQASFEIHHYGLFAREQWLALLRESGFAARLITPPDGHDLFLGVRRS